MNWRLEFAAGVEKDILEAADWYESRQPGLGAQFVEEIIDVWNGLTENPLLNCRRHPTKNIRWRYSNRFPYRVIYEVDEDNRTIRVAAILHGAKHETHWRRRVTQTQSLHLQFINRIRRAASAAAVVGPGHVLDLRAAHIQPPIGRPGERVRPDQSLLSWATTCSFNAGVICTIASCSMSLK